jgi:hypothetical protein
MDHRPAVGIISSLLQSTFMQKPPDTTHIEELSEMLLSLFLVQQSSLPSWKEAASGILDLDMIQSPASVTKATLNVSFKRMLQVLTEKVTSAHSIIILYALLTKNMEFRNFCCAQIDPEKMVRRVHLKKFYGLDATAALILTNLDAQIIPLVKAIFFTFFPPSGTAMSPVLAGDNSSSQSIPYSYIYVIMICLIILSSDDAYLDNLMNVSVPIPDWLGERITSKISLASIISLVIIRVTQCNLANDRDKYLHVNCVAILSNLSRSWKNMHSLVARRLTSWLEVVSRRYSRLEAVNSGLQTASSGSTLIPSQTPRSPNSSSSIMDPEFAFAMYRFSICDTHELNPVFKNFLPFHFSH